MKKDIVNCEKNAIVTCSKSDDSKYYNLRVIVTTKEGNTINLICKPLARDNKQLAKLMYKLFMELN